MWRLPLLCFACLGELSFAFGHNKLLASPKEPYGLTLLIHREAGLRGMPCSFRSRQLVSSFKWSLSIALYRHALSDQKLPSVSSSQGTSVEYCDMTLFESECLPCRAAGNVKSCCLQEVPRCCLLQYLRGLLRVGSIRGIPCASNG